MSLELAYNRLEEVALRARRRVDKPSLREAMEAYRAWLEAKARVEGDDLKGLGRDCAKIELEVKRFIERMCRAYAEARIGIDDPHADELYELSACGYPLLKAMLLRGRALTPESIEEFIAERRFEEIEELPDSLKALLDKLPPGDAARVLHASRIKLGLKEAEEARGRVEEWARRCVALILEGEPPEALGGARRLMEEAYADYLAAMRVAGKPAKRVEELVVERLGGWCLRLLESPSSEDVRGDVEASSRLYKLYDLAHRARVEYMCNTAASRMAALRARWLRRAKALKRFLVERRDDVERIKTRYGRALPQWIEEAEAMTADVEYDPSAEMKFEEEEMIQSSLTCFIEGA